MGTRRIWLCNVANGTTLSTSNVLAEDGTAATSVTPGAGGTLTGSSDTSHHGGLSFKCDPGTGVSQAIRLPFASSNVTQRISFYHRAESALNAATQIMTIRNSGAVTGRVQVAADGTVSILNSAGAAVVASTSGAWASGRQNRFEVSITADTASTGRMTITVYNGDDRTPLAGIGTSAGSFGTTALTHIEIGSPAAATLTTDHYFDTIQTEDGDGPELGPYIPLNSWGIEMGLAIPFIGYLGSGNDTSGIPAARKSGDFILVAAVGGSALTTPTGYEPLMITADGGGFRGCYYKISDGTETSVTVTNSGSTCATVYRGPTIASVIGYGGGLLTQGPLDPGSPMLIHYAFTQNGTATGATGPAGYPVAMRGQTAAGSFYRTGAADEPGVPGTLPARTFASGSSALRVATIALYGSGSPTATNISYVNHVASTAGNREGTYPGSLTVGNLLLCSNASEADQVGVDTLTDWTLRVAKAIVTSGPAQSIWSRTVATGSETGTFTLPYTPTNPGTNICDTSQFSKSSGSWGLAITKGTDTDTSSTQVNVTAEDTIGITAGDVIYFAVAGSDDTATVDHLALCIPGCTLGPITYIHFGGTSVGTDVSNRTGYVAVTSGTATGPIQLTGISTPSNASAGFIRLRAS